MAFVHMLSVAYDTDSGIKGYCNPITKTDGELTIPLVQQILRATEQELSQKYKSTARCAVVSVLPLSMPCSEDFNLEIFPSSLQ